MSACSHEGETAISLLISGTGTIKHGAVSFTLSWPPNNFDAAVVYSTGPQGWTNYPTDGLQLATMIDDTLSDAHVNALHESAQLLQLGHERQRAVDVTVEAMDAMPGAAPYSVGELWPNRTDGLATVRSDLLGFGVASFRVEVPGLVGEQILRVVNDIDDNWRVGWLDFTWDFGVDCAEGEELPRWIASVLHGVTAGVTVKRPPLRTMARKDSVAVEFRDMPCLNGLSADPQLREIVR